MSITNKEMLEAIIESKKVRLSKVVYRHRLILSVERGYKSYDSACIILSVELDSLRAEIKSLEESLKRIEQNQ